MTFKQDLQDDCAAFVALDEFAQLLDVDGVLCKAQLLKHSADKSNRLQESFDGLHGDFAELFILARPYLAKHNKLPHRGDLMFINAVRYEVLRAEDELGILHFLLSAYRQAVPRRGDWRL